jgi:hypothetical protein
MPELASSSSIGTMARQLRALGNSTASVAKA